MSSTEIREGFRPELSMLEISPIFYFRNAARDALERTGQTASLHDAQS
jgi:hypothetical protein